jgi:hypothetical protein
MTARTAGQSGAEAELSGTIAINATWSEDIYFRTPDGAAMDLTGLDFELQFRTSPDTDTTVKTLSITGGELSIETDDGAVDSILRISVTAGAFASYPGDLVTDIVAIDGSGAVTLYAHGIVSFVNNPSPV